MTAPVFYTVPTFYRGGTARPVTTLSGLLLAQEAGAADEVDKAALALEQAIRIQAKAICDQYVQPMTDYRINAPRSGRPIWGA